jgi:hypothetical protein
MLDNIGYALAYSGVGIALLVLGFVALDLLTPGRLASHIWEERSVNAGIVLSSGFIGLGLVIFTAIWTNSTRASARRSAGRSRSACWASRSRRWRSCCSTSSRRASSARPCASGSSTPRHS